MKNFRVKKQTIFFTLILLLGTITYGQNRSPFALRLHRSHTNQPTKPYRKPQTNDSNPLKFNDTACIQWQRTYGGSGDEDGGITKLSDGNYLEWGSTESSDGDFTENRGHYDAFIMKLDPKGKILWQQTYGGGRDEDFNDVIETGNGNFMALGTTSSNHNDVSGNHGGVDLWVVEVTSTGKMISQKCYGGSGDENAGKILKSDDNNYVFSGSTNSNDGDVTGNHGDFDAWIVDINTKGKIQWQKCIGGSDYDDNFNIIKTNGKSLFIAGNSYSINGDVHGNHGGYGDAWAVKLNIHGRLLWSRCYGGSADEYCSGIVMMKDGNLAVSCATNSNDGDVSGNHGGYDIWIPKIKQSNGDIIWQKCFGQTQCCSDQGEAAYGIISTHDGGVVAMGAVGTAFDNPSLDAIAIKVNEDGNEIWTKTFGGSQGDYAFGGAETDDGDIVIQCNTDSDDGDVTNLHNAAGDGDAWLVKLGNCRHDSFTDSKAIAKPFTNNNAIIKTLLTNYPNPFSSSTIISFTLQQTQKVSIQIFDKTGRLIKLLANEQMQQGAHQLVWNAKDGKETEVNAGVYFLKLQTGNHTETKKLVVIK